MTFKRNDIHTKYTDLPRRLVIRFRDRTLTLGEPYPVNSLEVDPATIGSLTLTITKPIADHFDRGYGPKVGQLELTKAIYELDIDEPCPDCTNPDAALCDFYEVNDYPGLVRELVGHVAQLQDAAKRNVKPWEDTFPPTLLPAYIERVGAANASAEHPLIATLHKNGELIAAEATVAQQAAMLATLDGLARELTGLLCDGREVPKVVTTFDILSNLVEQVRAIRSGHDEKTPAVSLKDSLTHLDFALMFALCNFAFVGARADVKKGQARFQEVKRFLIERDAQFLKMREELSDMYADYGDQLAVFDRYPDPEPLK